MMEAKYITLTKENIEKEHICCAFSDKKCKDSYELKKAWLKKEFDNGYIFRRLDERAKVFIEYVPAEKPWIPVTAFGYRDNIKDTDMLKHYYNPPLMTPGRRGKRGWLR